MTNAERNRWQQRGSEGPLSGTVRTPAAQMNVSALSNIISKYFPFLMMRNGGSGIRTQSLFGYRFNYHLLTYVIIVKANTVFRILNIQLSSATYFDRLVAIK